MNLSELDGRLFATTTETSEILPVDPRTLRRAIEAGEIPATRVGNRIMIPTAWIRQQIAGAAPSEPAALPLDLDQLADQVADRVFARFASLFGALTPNTGGPGPAPPEPGHTAADTSPTGHEKRRRRHDTATA